MAFKFGTFTQKLGKFPFNLMNWTLDNSHRLVSYVDHFNVQFYDRQHKIIGKTIINPKYNQQNQLSHALLISNCPTNINHCFTVIVYDQDLMETYQRFNQMLMTSWTVWLTIIMGTDVQSQVRSPVVTNLMLILTHHLLLIISIIISIIINIIEPIRHREC